jgi:ribosomal protein S27AE
MDSWTRRYQWHLDAVPGLLLQVRASVVPFSAAPQGGRVSGSRGIPLPFRVGPMDDADLLWSLLVLYATEVVELVGGSSPAVLRSSVATWTVGEAQGLRARMGSVAAAHAAGDIVGWLIGRSWLIAGFEVLQESEDQLFGFVRRLRQQYGLDALTPRAGRARLCTTCGERSVVVHHATSPAGEVFRVSCLRCGLVYEEGVWRGADADVSAGGVAGAALRADDQAVEA